MDISPNCISDVLLAFQYMYHEAGACWKARLGLSWVQNTFYKEKTISISSFIWAFSLESVINYCWVSLSLNWNLSLQFYCTQASKLLLCQKIAVVWYDKGNLINQGWAILSTSLRQIVHQVILVPRFVSPRDGPSSDIIFLVISYYSQQLLGLFNHKYKTLTTLITWKHWT